MLRVPYDVLRTPVPVYGSERQPAKIATRWKISGLKFYRTPSPRVFQLCFLKQTDVRIENYLTSLRSKLVQRGLQLQVQHSVEPLNDFSEIGIDTVMERAKTERGASMVVLAIPSKSIPVYSIFKDLADRKHGLHSICFAKPNTQESKMDDYMENVMMKYNLKFGGINHCVNAVRERLKDHTMVLGADVVHAGSGSFPGTPAIAGIVGSVDSTGGKFLGSVRLQTVDKKDKEVSRSGHLLQSERTH